MARHSFDEVIPSLLGVVIDDPNFATSVDRACVVRDLRGRVRLILGVKERLQFDVGPLEQALQHELGAWFAGPVLTTTQRPPASARLAQTLLQQATPWPARWPVEGVRPARAALPIRIEQWCAIQRVHSKQAWISSVRVGDPWKLIAQRPAVISFYSFKGGVGRTTTLGIVAWQLARQGKKVVCIDLDLEAPGLASFLGVNAGSGVLDYLLRGLATEDVSWQDDLLQEVNVHGATIHVISTGLLDAAYIEKLGRLDFLGGADERGATESPVTKLLRELLKQVERNVRPDYILIDSRAGLHDIGGLSLHELSHIDVLVGRNSEQGLAGLDIALSVLGRRREPDVQRIVIVQTFVPLPLADPESRANQQRYRERVYASMERHVYSLKPDDMPDLDDETVAHFPWPIGQYDELPKADTLPNISSSVLENEPYEALRRRIAALAEREDEAEDTEEAP